MRDSQPPGQLASAAAAAPARVESHSVVPRRTRCTRSMKSVAGFCPARAPPAGSEGFTTSLVNTVPAGKSPSRGPRGINSPDFLRGTQRPRGQAPRKTSRCSPGTDSSGFPGPGLGAPGSQLSCTLQGGAGVARPVLIFTESVPASVTIILAPDCVPDWPPDSVHMYLALFPLFLLKIASRFDIPSRSLPQPSPGWGHTPRGWRPHLMERERCPFGVGLSAA